MLISESLEWPHHMYGSQIALIVVCTGAPTHAYVVPMSGSDARFRANASLVNEPPLFHELVFILNHDSMRRVDGYWRLSWWSIRTSTALFRGSKPNFLLA